MDTKGIINADWVRLKGAEECGWMKYSVKREGGHVVKTRCKNWDCDDCSEKMIKKLIGLLDLKIASPLVFVAATELKSKQFDNWMTRHKPDRNSAPRFFYVAFHFGDGHTTIISSHKLRGIENSTRKSKPRYLEQLSKFLRENHRELKGVSHSITKSAPKKAKFLFADVSKEQILEFEALETDREKAEWLRDIPRIKLKKLGIEFIRNVLGD